MSGKIAKIIVLNGVNNHTYIAGQRLDMNNTHTVVMVDKIKQVNEKYIVFLSNHQEIEIVTNNILVFWQY